MNKIHFTKMSGAGNDYIYVDAMHNTICDPQNTAIRWSDRHKGIGADGLVLIDRSPVPEADFSMRIFNADGSEAMMCGNAARCIGKYLYERGLTDKTVIRLLTLSGIKIILLTVEGDRVVTVSVDMLQPAFENTTLFLPEHDPGVGIFVSMGNPHYVVFTDDVDQVAGRGRDLECHPAFPERCNIEFAHITDDGCIKTRVWERGSGITMACGTGACATAVAAVLTQHTDRRVKVIMDGGTLDVEWRISDNHVFLTGPADFVFDGEISDNE